MTSPNEFVTLWIQDLKSGEDQATTDLWNRYFGQIVDIAKKRLGAFPARVADAEDVALSVFNSLCEGAAAGRFTELHDRNDLWRLLVKITGRKAIDLIRFQNAAKRGPGVRGESVFSPTDSDQRMARLDQAAVDEMTPERVESLLDDTFFGILGQLNDVRLEEVARMRMHGHSNEDIAQQLQISVSSVERKLRLIRAKWSIELER